MRLPTEHNHEDAPYDRVRYGDKQCPELAQHTQNDHDESTSLDHPPACHLLT